eukprot:scaffold84570_cov30-Tisochrysis_lutea.AAC.2
MRQMTEECGHPTRRRGGALGVTAQPARESNRRASRCEATASQRSSPARVLSSSNRCRRGAAAQSAHNEASLSRRQCDKERCVSRDKGGSRTLHPIWRPAPPLPSQLETALSTSPPVQRPLPPRAPQATSASATTAAASSRAPSDTRVPVRANIVSPAQHSAAVAVASPSCLQLDTSSARRGELRDATRDATPSSVSRRQETSESAVRRGQAVVMASRALSDTLSPSSLMERRARGGLAIELGPCPTLSPPAADPGAKEDNELIEAARPRSVT